MYISGKDGISPQEGLDFFATDFFVDFMRLGPVNWREKVLSTSITLRPLFPTHLDLVIASRIFLLQDCRALELFFFPDFRWELSRRNGDQ
jgi:hypothetical protein